MKAVWITLVFLLGAGALYLVLAARPADKQAATDYEELAACAFLTSIDSTKSLYLSPSHVARMSTTGGTGTQWDAGTWMLLDDDKRLFEIRIAGTDTTYTLVSAPEGEGCMLVPGDTSKADLAKSWFSTLQDPK